jgi:glycosyltransferase involved in cell wall biosynthesis
LTLKSIDSLNKQTYENVEKILVNANTPPHQTKTLIEMGANLTDWKIIDFPIDSMNLDPRSQLSHHLTGQAALFNSTGDFFFSLNDDDFIDRDYFLFFAKLFSKYSNAVSGMGLVIPYFHQIKKSGNLHLPVDKNLDPRPVIESGIDAVRKIFNAREQRYQLTLGVQPILRRDYAQEVSKYMFGSGGFPDTSTYFQVVVRGDTVFSYDSIFYWGRHDNRQSSKYSDQHYWEAICERDFKNFSEINVKVFTSFYPNSRKDVKMIKTFFKRQLIESSIIAFSKWRKNNLIFAKKSENATNNETRLNSHRFTKFPFLKHLKIVLKHPVLLCKSIKFLLDQRSFYGDLN